jgi:hypothetical protein
MPIPPAIDLDRAAADVVWLVEEIGPRAPGSPQEQAAADGVRERLRAAGWTPQDVGMPGNQVACRGRGSALLLAHIDSVEGSPGAVDNAVGVATLLELARTSAAPDLCLAFPVAEEVGLAGSRVLAERVSEWHPSGGLPDLVVALDLTGHGSLSMMGLGKTWGDDQLAWLTGHLDPVPDTIWPYAVYSRLLPRRERSDHAPFATLGVPAMLLLGRGEGGIFPRYHQPNDTEFDAEALAATAAALESLALATPPPPPTPSALPNAAFVAWGHRVPSGLTWAATIAGLAAAAHGLLRWREVPGHLLRGALALGLTALLTVPLISRGWVPSHPAEQTAEAVMGVAATGWWWGAWLALGLGAAVAMGVRRVMGPRGSAPLAAGLMAAPLAYVDPVLALPLSVGAILGLIHPLLAVLPAAVLLRPDALRELTFHGLIPPTAWGLLWVLAWPALGSYTRKPPTPPRGAPTASES